MKKMMTAWVLGALAVGLAACGGSQAPSAPASTPAAAPVVAAAAVPAEYAGKQSPIPAGDAAAVAAGQKLFVENCGTCHGETGHGDGAAAAALEPKPRNLTEPGYIAGLSDDRLYWRISEGGASGPAGSAMPAWKTILKEEQIWQTIAYVRSLTK